MEGICKIFKNWTFWLENGLGSFLTPPRLPRSYFFRDRKNKNWSDWFDYTFILFHWTLVYTFNQNCINTFAIICKKTHFRPFNPKFGKYLNNRGKILKNACKGLKNIKQCQICFCYSKSIFNFIFTVFIIMLNIKKCQKYDFSIQKYHEKIWQIEANLKSV